MRYFRHPNSLTNPGPPPTSPYQFLSGGFGGGGEGEKHRLADCSSTVHTTYEVEMHIGHESIWVETLITTILVTELPILLGKPSEKEGEGKKQDPFVISGIISWTRRREGRTRAQHASSALRSTSSKPGIRPGCWQSHARISAVHGYFGLPAALPWRLNCSFFCSRWRLLVNCLSIPFLASFCSRSEPDFGKLRCLATVGTVSKVVYSTFASYFMYKP